MTHDQEDLVVLVTPQHVVGVRVNTRTHVLTKLPVHILERSDDPDRFLVRILGRAGKNLMPRRILLSVVGDVPHDALAVPVFDALSDLAVEIDRPLIWVPDVRALADILHD